MTSSSSSSSNVTSKKVAASTLHKTADDRNGEIISKNGDMMNLKDSFKSEMERRRKGGKDSVYNQSNLPDEHIT